MSPPTSARASTSVLLKRRVTLALSPTLISSKVLLIRDAIFLAFNSGCRCYVLASDPRNEPHVYFCCQNRARADCSKGGAPNRLDKNQVRLEALLLGPLAAGEQKAALRLMDCHSTLRLCHFHIELQDCDFAF